VRAMLPRIAIRVRRHSDSVGWSAIRWGGRCRNNRPPSVPNARQPT
jgi:hypothetical protein